MNKLILKSITLFVVLSLCVVGATHAKEWKTLREQPKALILRGTQRSHPESSLDSTWTSSMKFAKGSD